MAASTYLAQVQQLYIAYFGRPADPIGQQYWATQIDAANGSIASVLAGFSASTESAALYGNKSTIDKVTAIYNNEFNRAPDAAGLAYWVAQIDSGKVTQAQAAWTIQQSAGAGDAATVQNKLTAAQAFTAGITTSAQISGYQGTGAADAGRAFLNTVTSVNATATAAVANVPTAVAAATAAGGTGSTFVFTTGVDNLVGTSGNDTFIADATVTGQLSAADSVNGGAGNDTFKVFLGTLTTFAQPTLTSVENVWINGGALLNYTAVAGTTGLTIEAPTVSAAYTVAGQTVTLKGATAATTTTITSTADTAANVVLNGWGSAALAETVNLTGAAVATANLTATGANSAITLQGTTALKTVNITGERNITVTADSALVLNAINASTATGNVNVDLSNVTSTNLAAAFAFTGGAGNDTLTLASGDLAKLTAGTQLNGGAGTDTLVIKDLTLAAADYAKLNAATGFEVLGVTTTAAGTAGAPPTLVNTVIDAGQLTSIKSFAVTNTAALTTDTINNLGAGSTVAFGNTTSATLTAALGNSATEISVGAAGAAGVTVGSLSLTGLTSLGLTSNGTSVNTITALNNADNSTITVKGATDLTITGALAGTSTGSKVDASAFTGKLTVTGSGLADIIIGGSGADTIIGGAGNDTLTGGAGADKFVVTNVTNGGIDWIKDFVAGTDKIITTGVATSTTAVSAVVDKGALSATTYGSLDLAVASFATGGANATQANTAYTFTYAGDNYVLVDNTGAGYTANADSLIKITGITGTLTAADIITA